MAPVGAERSLGADGAGTQPAAEPSSGSRLPAGTGHPVRARLPLCAWLPLSARLPLGAGPSLCAVSLRCKPLCWHAKTLAQGTHFPLPFGPLAVLNPCGDSTSLTQCLLWGFPLMLPSNKTWHSCYLPPKECSTGLLAIPPEQGVKGH